MDDPQPRRRSKFAGGEARFQMKSGIQNRTGWTIVLVVAALSLVAWAAAGDRRDSDTAGVIDARVQRQALLAEMQQMNANLREMTQLLKDIRTRLPEPVKTDGRGAR